MSGNGRLWHSILNTSLAVKMMTCILGLSVLFVAGVYWQIDTTWHALAMKDLRDRAVALAEHEAQEVTPLLRNGDGAALRNFAQDMGRGSPEVQSVQLLDGRGQMLLDNNPTGSREPLTTVTVPLGRGTDGFIRVAMFESHVTSEVNWMVRRLMASIGAFVIMALLAAWWLTRRVTRPMCELVAAARAVREGNYRNRAPVHAADEVGQLASAFNDMAAELERREAVRRRLLRQVIVAGEEERRRVARDLHDQAGQTLTALIAGLGTSGSNAHTPPMEDLRALAAEAYREVHDLSRALRPRALDDEGLVAALQEHCRNFANRLGVRVDCETVGIGGERLPGEVEVTLYRIVQEALTNAVRHGHARAVQVLLQRRNGNLLAVIEDDGCGFDARHWRESDRDGVHLGLLGIQERVNLLGGRFDVESREGGGTGVFVDIPVGRANHD